MTQLGCAREGPAGGVEKGGVRVVIHEPRRGCCAANQLYSVRPAPVVVVVSDGGAGGARHTETTLLDADLAAFPSSGRFPLSAPAFADTARLVHPHPPGRGGINDTPRVVDCLQCARCAISPGWHTPPSTYLGRWLPQDCKHCASQFTKGHQLGEAAYQA